MARALGPWQSTRKGWSLPAKLQPFTPLSQRRCVYYSGIGPGHSEESEPHRAPLWELRPLIEAGAPSTGGAVVSRVCAPHRGSHGRTTDDPAQRRGGAKRRAGGDALETPARKWRTMGRIEHTLLDEGRASSPTDLRPSPAAPPYHKK